MSWTPLQMTFETRPSRGVLSISYRFSTRSSSSKQAMPSRIVGLRCWPESSNILHDGSQQFRHTPCLSNAAPREMGRVAVENFGDLSQSHIGNMI